VTGRAADILTSAAAFHGELHRMLLACGIVLLVLFVVWALEEWRIAKSAAALSWLGFICLGLVGCGAVLLIAIGLLFFTN
jgi:hypothetical protein